MSFFEAIRTSGGSILVRLPNAGHTQFLDRRGELPLDPCNVGKDRDKDVVLLCCQIVVLWAQACTSPTTSPPTSVESVSDSALASVVRPTPWLSQVRTQVDDIAARLGIAVAWSTGA